MRAVVSVWPAFAYTVIGMASEHITLDGYQQLCTAPDHVIDMILALMPCPNPTDVERIRARRAEARAYANRIWAEAAHAGAVWGLARAPFKMEIDLSNAPALGDLIRATEPTT